MKRTITNPSAPQIARDLARHRAAMRAGAKLDKLKLRCRLRTSLDPTVADAAAAEQAERLRMAGGSPKLEMHGEEPDL